MSKKLAVTMKSIATVCEVSARSLRTLSLCTCLFPMEEEKEEEDTYKYSLVWLFYRSSYLCLFLLPHPNKKKLTTETTTNKKKRPGGVLPARRTTYSTVRRSTSIATHWYARRSYTTYYWYVVYVNVVAIHIIRTTYNENDNDNNNSVYQCDV